ncbi:MAG: tetraacyldisaccharide 4'-kinase [Bacteroidales bacterium]|nr:tetraacyldisaccharide 4'-kinase [Bacteroidales bacterium]MBR1782858.1 tetraacyldisaccharide 4'-kinase [Bacteroidales bacterium]
MIYRLILSLRHLFYDKGWKKSREADVPTICVGNVTVGGTGKTPHTELILRLLMNSDKWAYTNLAMLSRGYKRRTKGFQLVPAGGSARLYGDEPVQIASKLRAVTVAVDKNRIRGCAKLCEENNAQLIVLDDAFQYRKLRPTLSIVLVDYNRPVNKDHLLPWGHLRDLPSRLKKADAVIVTKCPAYLDEADKDRWRRQLGIGLEKPLFFTTVNYIDPEPVFPEADPHYIYSQRLMLVTGIANNASLRSHLSDKYKIERRMEYRDHHRFTSGDMRKVASAVKSLPTACIMTTEKDAQRMRDVKKVPDKVKQRLFYVPIKAAFLSEEQEAAFTEFLLGRL